MVSIKAGPRDDCSVFQTYKGLLCHYSPFFRASLNGNFKEAHDNVITLEHDEPAVFQMFHSWMFTRRPIDTIKDSDPQQRMYVLAKAWVFGDARGIPSFQNDVMDEFISTSVSHWEMHDHDTTTWIYENTVEDSPLRGFFVEFLITSDEESIRETLLAERAPDGDSRHPDFLRDIAIGLTHSTRKELVEEDWNRAVKRRYHVRLSAEAEG